MAGFTVVDTATGQPPNLARLAEEPWAKHLIWSNMAGFALCDDGMLILTDTCGNYACCPPGRFTITVLP
jgi:hypothetical protein